MTPSGAWPPGMSSIHAVLDSKGKSSKRCKLHFLEVLSFKPYREGSQTHAIVALRGDLHQALKVQLGVMDSRQLHCKLAADLGAPPSGAAATGQEAIFKPELQFESLHWRSTSSQAAFWCLLFRHCKYYLAGAA